MSFIIISEQYGQLTSKATKQDALDILESKRINYPNDVFICIDTRTNEKIEFTNDNYQIPEPVYFDTPQRLWCIIDTMPKSILSDFKEYSDALTIATSLEDKNKAMDVLTSGISIYFIDAYIYWAETYVRLERYKKKIFGIDNNIEISLKEYGIAWSIEKNKLTIYYGIRQELNDCNEYEWVEFDWNCYPMNINVREEWNWANFEEVNDFVGGGFFNQDLPYQIFDLLSYYGSENLFGSSYCGGIKYENIVKEQKNG